MGKSTLFNSLTGMRQHTGNWPGKTVEVAQGTFSYRGREYRLATYLGARSIQIDEDLVRIRQGKMELEARLLEPAEKRLRAPHQGKMARTIHESAACKAFYRFRKDGRTIFALESDRASFEYEK